MTYLNITGAEKLQGEWTLQERSKILLTNKQEEMLPSFSARILLLILDNFNYHFHYHDDIFDVSFLGVIYIFLGSC